nr:Ti-type conjugative transfer system protein TraG [Neorhizobium xiangyangii]
MPLITTLVVWIAVTALWPHIASGLVDQTQYWFMRSRPFPLLVVPSLACFATVALMPLHLRRPVALSGLLSFLAVALIYGMGEYFRLSPYVYEQGMSWNHVLRSADLFVVAGSIVGFVACGFAARLSVVTDVPVKRARIGSFGDADWMSMKDAAKLFPDDGEIVVGERYRVDRDLVKDVPFDPAARSTWGRGGKEQLLTYKFDFDSTHMLYFAGSGGFKTTSNVIPTALRYRGPVICLDPSTEVVPMVVAHRERALGRKCFVLDPKNPTVGFNVLDWIATSSNKEEDIVNFAQLLLSESSGAETSTGSYFQNQAHNLLTGLLAHVLLSDEYANARNLKSLRQIVSEPEPSVLEMLRTVQQESSSTFIRETLGVFTNMTEQTFSGVYSTASKDTQWLSLDAYAALTCGDSFTSSDIAKGEFDIFLNLPASILRSYPGIGRVIVGSLLNAMIQADGKFAKRALFMLDEVDLLGYMRLLEEARDRGRKYGISLMLMYQSVGQMEKHFGREGARSWIEGSAFSSYAAIKSMETAREVSASCGEMTVEVAGQSKSVGMFGAGGTARATESLSYQRRPLIMPHEITQTMRKDEQIIVVQGHPPLRCGRAVYFRRNDMAAQAQANRFAPKGS